MKAAVLDTSAIVRLYVPDGPLPEGLEDRVAEATAAEAVLMVPEIALAEVAHVLLKKERKGLLRRQAVDEIMEAFMELPVDVIGHGDLVTPALAIAREHDLTVYDSLFVALALSRRADLLTCDGDVARAHEAARSRRARGGA